jgi:Flagellar biosynthesis pathway, component FliP
MSNRINEGTFDSLVSISAADTAISDMHSAPLRVMVPAFMLSEMSRAFEIAFYILLPFLIVDLIVSAILMSMGMMMVPPAIVALPFKLAFLVVSDGFTKVSKALVEGYM